MLRECNEEASVAVVGKSVDMAGDTRWLKSRVTGKPAGQCQVENSGTRRNCHGEWTVTAEWTRNGRAHGHCVSCLTPLEMPVVPSHSEGLFKMWNQPSSSEEEEIRKSDL